MAEPIRAYPLAWPDGWPRLTPMQRTRARFSKGERKYSSDGQRSWPIHRELTISDGTTRVLRELQTFGVLDGDAIISTNLVLRLDGLPRSGQSQPADPGVAVYWQRPGEKAPKVMAIDRYDRVADNLAAIAATLDAMRAIERHGGAQILERAFSGFARLPAPGQTSARGWREVLGLPPSGAIDRDTLDKIYRLERSRAHPDRPTGHVGRFQEVQTAYEQAKMEIGA